MIKIILVIFVLILGLYFISMSCKKPKIENFTGTDNNEKICPNMLIEREGKYFLYNSKIAIVPGVNPIQFNTLEEYTEFLDWQRGQGINCPVLQLQYSTDTQNNEIYKIKPNIFENQGGLPREDTLNNQPKPLMSSEISKIFDANTEDPPFNQGGHIAFDANNQYIGLKTPIDLIGFQGDKSPSAMDQNWGGIQFTKTHIENNLNTNKASITNKPSITRDVLANNTASNQENQKSVVTTALGN